MKPSIKEKIRQNHRLYVFLSISVCLLLILLGSALLAPLVVQTINDPQKFRDLVAQKGVWGYLLFILIQMLQVVFAFIPGEVVEVGAGYAFGTLWGTVLCLIGVFLSSVLIFFAVRKFGHRLALVLMDSRTVRRLSFLRDNKKMELILFVLYFLPGTPKDILTYFAGLTKINPTVFLLICTFGRIPSVITSTMAGSALVESNYKTTLLIFAVTGALALVGYLIYYLCSKPRKAKAIKKESSK